MPRAGYGLLLGYVLRQWPILILVVLFAILNSAATALRPWPIKMLVDDALSPQRHVDGILGGILKMIGGPQPLALVCVAGITSFVIFLINGLFDSGLSLAWTAASQRMVAELSTDVFGRLERLSTLFHSRNSAGDSLSRITDDAWCIGTSCNVLLIAPSKHFLIVISVGILAWQLDAQLAAITLAAVPVLVGSARLFGRKLKERARLNREAKSHLLAFVLQTLNAIPVVQAFGTEKRNKRRFRDLAEEAVALEQSTTLLNSAYEIVNGLAFTIAAAIVFFYGGKRVISGALSIGSLVIFFSYLRTLQFSWQVLLKNYASLRSVQASVDRVLEVFNTPDEVRDVPGAQPLGSPAVPRGRHLRLDNISFWYQTGLPVLKNISLEAIPGEVVALVGPTGAGKTTLASLIPRFVDPGEGAVFMDGTDIRELRLSSVRSQVAWVPQDAFLLPVSMAENIAYGRPGATAEQIEAAARAANADGFIRALPDGYQTLCGERGATLSGGEKQRIAIARALLKDASILILDEPTSSLDAQTEALVMEALRRLVRGRTTFIIAHRLSTVRLADRIVVLERGRIVDQGTHTELMAAGGLYHSLYSLQMGHLSQEVNA